MISNNLHVMLQKMEQSSNEEWAVEAECLRFDVEEWAKAHACYRCSHANWMVEPVPIQIQPKGQPKVTPKFAWQILMGHCGAWQPVALDHFPPAPFYCSAEQQEADGVPVSSQPMFFGQPGGGEAEQAQMPRQRGEAG